MDAENSLLKKNLYGNQETRTPTPAPTPTPTPTPPAITPDIEKREMPPGQITRAIKMPEQQAQQLPSTETE